MLQHLLLEQQVSANDASRQSLRRGALSGPKGLERRWAVGKWPFETTVTVPRRYLELVRSRAVQSVGAWIRAVEKKDFLEVFCGSQIAPGFDQVNPLE